MDFCVCASLFLVTDNAIILFRLIRPGFKSALPSDKQRTLAYLY